jgi:hypothetical protein
MFVADVHDYDPPETAVVKAFLSEGRKKDIQDAVDRIVDEEFERLDEYAEEHISQTAARRAEKFLERVLTGDDDAAMSLLGETANGRHRTVGSESAPWAQLIHGTLFETGGIRLRRQIVEAHADLIRNERIADLESVVEGLTKQIHALTRNLEASQERARYHND